MHILAPALDNLRENNASAVLVRLYQYWLDKRRTLPFPSRKDIDPLDFAFAFSRVSLIDVLNGPRRFRYRLVSTALTDRLGYEMTNKFTEEIPEDDVRQYVENLYNWVLDSRLPIYEKSTRTFKNQIWQHEALVLPLSSDGETIDMIMAYRWTYDPEPVPRWARV
jgi:hypothetical protein